MVTLAVLGLDVLRFGVVTGPAVGRTVGTAPTDAAIDLLLGGTLGGCMIAGAAAWWLLAPIDSLYRRAGLALASSFATVVLMLAAVPVHRWAGQPGLAGFALLLATGALLFAVRARRAARDG
ncbi:MAG TPA: hypothetical protein VK688_10650 [Gemmatimonadales bacterium]|nr:hypothetical protein [Gemmatimonadales bacterium]